MPQFTLPKLSGQFQEIGTCIVVESAKPTLMRWAKRHTADDAVATFLDGKEHRWLELNVDAWEGKRVHFHLELASVELEHKDKRTYGLEDILKVANGFLEVAGGDEALIRSRARFAVAESDIPPHSAVGKLLAFSHEVCGASIGMNGASLSIEDDVFTRITFNRVVDEKQAYIELFALFTSSLDGEYFDRLHDLMRIGVDSFIYEQISRESSHA